jgi:F-type H+-transporting ATPase subunit alpha
MKQDQFVPLTVEKQVLIIFAGTNGYLDPVPVSECQRYEQELFSFVDTNHGTLLKGLREKKQIDDGIRGQITRALDEFKERFAAS